MKDKFPEKFIVPNPYNLPVHDQGDKNNCTSHAFAIMWEYKLSKLLKEPVLRDVDDLWEKQKKFGTATEEGDTMEGVIQVANQYGMLFETKSGRKGVSKPNQGIEFL